MNFNMTNRHSFSALVILFYLLPVLFFSVYSIRLMSAQKSWVLLSTGLFIAMSGACLFFFLLYYWERSLRVQQGHSSLSQFPYSSLREEKVAILDSTVLFNSSLPLKQERDEEREEGVDKELNLLQIALEESQEELETFKQILERKEEETRRLEEENKQLSSGMQQAFQDFADYKLFSEEQLKQKQGQLSALQQMIEDQRAEMEKRQEQIYQLDTKVHDLSYEIKTLLFLHEEEAAASSKKKEEQSVSAGKGLSFHWESLPLETEGGQQAKELATQSVHTPLDAIYLLKKCIQLSQKITGAHYYGQDSSRYSEFSPSYAIDQRRLFDLLREETAALILVYSPKEDKVLFANSQSRTLLGWSPEKLVADFSFIMQEGIQEWKKTLHAMTTVSEAQVRLLAKTRQGQEVVLNGQLGLIPNGLFRGYLLGVFYHCLARKPMDL